VTRTDRVPEGAVASTRVPVGGPTVPTVPVVFVTVTFVDVTPGWGVVVWVVTRTVGVPVVD
jgi:hypothetical protein